MKPEIVILGAGESGTGAAVLAKKKGYNVFVSDKGKVNQKFKNVLSQFEINYEEEKHTESKILNASEIVKSPGISDSVSIVKAIKSKGIPVISEIEFASRYTDAKMVCISGSNGKTTTTLLMYHILKTEGLNVGLAGNVGKSFAMQVALNDYGIYVLELSSFQLDGMFDFKADIAILLNITPDHLDRYENDLRNYADSKFRIIQNQTIDDDFIFCADDKTIMEELEKRNISAKKHSFSLNKKPEHEGYISDNELIIKTKSNTIKMTLEELALQGKHNLYNSMAAGIGSKLIDIRKDTIKKCLSDFQNVEHRLEHVATIHGIEFINDSKATNVNSSWYALESMDNPVIWIAGGIDKGNDYSFLKNLVKEKVKAIVCLGTDNSKIQNYFADDVEIIVETSSASEAVHVAFNLGENGDSVLLSPACASFDLFNDYEDRGEKFKNAVNNL